MTEQLAADLEELDYRQWRETVKKKPFGAGWNGALLVLSTLAVTVVAAFFGLQLFGPGTYPRIVLAAPGLAAGWLFYVATARLFFRLRPRAARVKA